MVGFRAAAWTCFAVSSTSFIIGLFGLRGVGIVGQSEKSSEPAAANLDIRLDDVEQQQPASETAVGKIVPAPSSQAIDTTIPK
jgi:hypothetical protein